MNRSELEELISAYIDNELSPPGRKKVESLVRSNSQAKAILDEYLAVRKFVKFGAENVNYSVPVNFSKSVMQAIEKQTATSEKVVAGEKNVFAASPKNSVYSLYSQNGNGFISRLRNVRIFTYPLIIVFVALMVSYFGSRDKSQTVNNYEPANTATNQIASNTQTPNSHTK
ncbi:MAG: anti-sigma factor family protein [Thermoguttaceae bacterium]